MSKQPSPAGTPSPLDAQGTYEATAIIERALMGGYGGAENLNQFLQALPYVPGTSTLRKEIAVDLLSYNRALRQTEEKRVGKLSMLVQQMETIALVGGEDAYDRLEDKLLDLGLDDEKVTPVVIALYRAFDWLTDAYVKAYKAMGLCMEYIADVMGWGRYLIDDPEFAMYLSRLFHGAIRGDTKISAEERGIMQLIVLANYASGGLDEDEKKKFNKLALDTIQVGGQVLRWGYISEIYDAYFLDRYEKANTQWSSGFQRLAAASLPQLLASLWQPPQIIVQMTVKGTRPYGFPFFIDTEGSWETGKIRGTVALEPLERFPAFITDHGGASTGCFGPPGCLDTDTEILTQEGWKTYDKVRDDETVATLDPDSGRLEYRRIAEKIVAPYKGLMYHLESTQVSLLVTPNHNLWVWRQPNHRSTNRKAASFSWKLPHQIFGDSEVYFKRDASWDGEDPKVKAFPQRTSGSGPRHPTLEVKMEEWMDFLGIWLAEGSTTTGNKGNYSVQVCNRTDAVVQKVFRLLKGWGLNPRILHQKNDPKHRHVVVLNKQLFDYLAPLGKSKTKYIPDEVKSLSRSLLGRLLESYIEGDGTTEDVMYTGHTRLRCQTSSPRLRDDLMEAALKAGMVANYHVHTTAGSQSVMIDADGRERTLTRTVDNYRLSLTKARGVTRIARPIVEEWKDHNGPVWCVNVPPHHLIYVRRNGKPVWIGNSGKTVALDAVLAYAVMKRSSIAFVPISDDTNQVNRCIIPLIPVSSDPRDVTSRNVSNLRDWGVEIAGIPRLTLDIITPETRGELQEATLTKYDAIIEVANPEYFRLDSGQMKLILGKLREHGEFPEFNHRYDGKTMGVINVRRLDTTIPKRRMNFVDAQIGKRFLDILDKWRYHNMNLPMRIQLDEIADLAPSLVRTSGGQDLLSLGVTIEKILRRHRRKDLPFDFASQRPVQIIAELRDSMTNVLFRDLSTALKSEQSQLEFLAGALQVEREDTLDAMKNIMKRGHLRGNHLMFWYNREERNVNLVQAVPPPFAVEVKGLSEEDHYKIWQKKFDGPADLFKTVEEVEVLLTASDTASDMDEVQKGQAKEDDFDVGSL